MVDLKKIKDPVVLFDGLCNLCVGSVQFIIKHDRKKQFRFASLQSSLGKAILQEAAVSENNYNSFILLEAEKIFTRSTAALRVCKQLSGGWKLLYVFIIIPAFIRDPMYSIIANNRYRWFGKKEKCWLPDERLKFLFLDQ